MTSAVALVRSSLCLALTALLAHALTALESSEARLPIGVHCSDHECCYDQ